MKRTVKVFAISILLIGGLFYAYQNYPILGYWAFGKARIIGKPISSRVKINNQEIKEAKVFKQETDLNGTKNENRFILFLPNKTKTETRNVLIIDSKNKFIGEPNSNRRDYEVIANYLFQSNSGVGMIPFSDTSKRDGFDPELKIKKNGIEFKLPNWSEYKAHRIEIIKNNNSN